MLVFQDMGATSTRLTLVRPDGSTIKTVMTQGQATTWSTSMGVGPGAALLLQRTGNTFAVMARDGTVAPVSDALAKYFDISKIGSLAYDAAFYTPTTVIGTLGYDTAQFVKIDLTTSEVSTLLTATRTLPTGGIAPPIVLNLGTSSSHDAVYILVRHANWGGQTVQQWAFVEIDLKTKVVMGFPTLPLAAGLDAYDGWALALSADGARFAYEANAPSTNGYAILRIHIAEVLSGKEVVAPDNAIRVIGQEGGMSFSPDGRFLAAYGEAPWPDAEGKITSKLIAFDVVTGLPVRTIDVGEDMHNMVQTIGWVGPHKLAYAAITTTTFGNFTNGAETDYVLDVATGSQTRLPSGFGRLVAVLNS